MKRTCILIAFLIATIAYSQDKFTFTENGISPEHIVSYPDSTSAGALYQKTLNWIENNNLEANSSTSIENKILVITGIKNNAVNKGKIYYHLKYTIELYFDNGKYKFLPTELLLKANSKYDMGWKPFDFRDGTPYFKKGKVIKKYRSYVNDIPKVLNEIYTSLSNYLKAE